MGIQDVLPSIKRAYLTSPSFARRLLGLNNFPNASFSLSYYTKAFIDYNNLTGISHC
jgi:hypothetical protein